MKKGKYMDNIFVVTEYYTVYCVVGLQCICLTHCRHAVMFFRRGTRVENAIICGHDEFLKRHSWLEWPCGSYIQLG